MSVSFRQVQLHLVLSHEEQNILDRQALELEELDLGGSCVLDVPDKKKSMMSKLVKKVLKEFIFPCTQNILKNGKMMKK
jgi:hypothetical protein